jgi:hypothetical protein
MEKVVVVKWVVTWPLAFEWERVVEVTRPLAFTGRRW